MFDDSVANDDGDGDDDRDGDGDDGGKAETVESGVCEYVATSGCHRGGWMEREIKSSVVF